MRKEGEWERGDVSVLECIRMYIPVPPSLSSPTATCTRSSGTLHPRAVRR